MATRTEVDVVFLNGWMYTGLDELPVPAAIAVREGRIVSTCADEVQRLAETAAECVDLGGQLLIPGFQDAHVHPPSGGVEMLSCDLSHCETAEETLAKIKEYAAAHPKVEWILGGGWSLDAFPGGTPTRAALDSIIRDRPVFLQNRDHHGAWFNSKAAELAGVDANTPDPRDGRLERDSDGTPSGTAHEGAMGLFDAVRPSASIEQVYDGLLAAQEHLISLGITAWQDAAVGKFMSRTDSLSAYLRAVEEGTLKARVRGAQWWNRTDGEAQLDSVLSRRDQVRAICSPERFSADTVKVMVDGVAENFTAAMHDCYLDGHGHSTENRGISFFDPEEMGRFVTELDRNGMQVHFHALGDRAVTEALDAIEQAQKANGPSGNRHHLAHLQVVRSEDVARFRDLDATANIQALWAHHDEQLDELTLPFLPKGAVSHHYPFGELTQEGAHLAAGSDWPVSSADPLQAIHVAVTRVAPGRTQAPLGPDYQRLTLKQALDAYTQGSAFVNHLDHVTGKLVEGYYADFAVIDRNLFDVPVQQLADACVTQTWVAGKLMFSMPARVS